MPATAFGVKKKKTGNTEINQQALPAGPDPRRPWADWLTHLVAKTSKKKPLACCGPGAGISHPSIPSIVRVSVPGQTSFFFAFVTIHHHHQIIASYVAYRLIGSPHDLHRRPR